MNLIIYVTGRPKIYGFKRHEFLWSEAHGVYLYGGKEIPVAEFNTTFDKVFLRYQGFQDLNPRVKVITPAVATPPAPPAAAPAPASETVDFGDSAPPPDKKKRLAASRAGK